MNIELFKDLTTSDHLAKIKTNGEKYSGLYSDMSNADERKYIKNEASIITAMLKKLDRARIDKTKAFKISIDEEAGYIKSVLEAANEPFTLLINDYNEERKKVLAEKKAKEDAAALLVQIEIDHASAIDMDKLMMFEQKEAKEAQEKRDAEIADGAAREAVKIERELQELLAVREGKAKQSREADIEHKRTINREAVKSLMEAGFTEIESKSIVSVVAAGVIANVSINY